MSHPFTVRALIFFEPTEIVRIPGWRVACNGDGEKEADAKEEGTILMIEIKAERLSCNRSVGPFAGLLLCLSVFAAPAAYATAYTFTNIDVPGMPGARARAISNTGAITGLSDLGDDARGFLYIGGSITTFAKPNSRDFNVHGINDSNAIVGGYTNPVDFTGHGFLYSGGIYTDIDVPGALNSEALDINNNGAVVGIYGDSSSVRGFLFSSGLFTPINVSGPYDTFVLGINDAGAIVGEYNDGVVGHGFLYSGGVFTTLDFPGGFDTLAQGINDNGDIVGTYSNTRGGPSLSFLYSGGVYTSLAVPGAAETEILAINNAGQVVGHSSLGHDVLGTPVLASVPEPGTLAWFGAALAVMVGIARRRAIAKNRTSRQSVGTAEEPALC